MVCFLTHWKGTEGEGGGVEVGSVRLGEREREDERRKNRGDTTTDDLLSPPSGSLIPAFG